ncbi:hypothetical protein KR215_004594 [Drosophila sulfurigaster]|uniref:uncharacterized protein LOC133837481 n=1 Tax=Drosophila sulfurigaster albostrigata TaxID=89887 RepID=UPI002D21B4EE|nr:uncharacterized protein LOC133837481 [Drosophila sulfurigaster albostrigata]KAH8399602.1 hypothetical protein KR215_004594 [Drosophila sulfurigaster]
MKYLLSVALLLAIGLHQIDAHGMMLNPPSRSSRWRYDSSAPQNYNDNELFCGGLYTQANNGGQCGLCGDNFSASQPRANEIGGSIGGSGTITKSYAAANAINVGVKITTNHLGHFEFNLCNLDTFGAESEACFNQNRLRFPDGSDKLQIGSQSGEFDVTVMLPEGLTCSHCVLRWTYVGANNWGMCDNGTGALGCGPQETFKNCADVSIFWGRNMVKELAKPAVQPVAPVEVDSIEA